MSAGDLDGAIKEKEEQLAAIKAGFTDKMTEMLEGYAALEDVPAGPEKDEQSLKLADRYEALSAERDSNVREVKDSGLVLMKAVKASKARRRDEL